MDDRKRAPTLGWGEAIGLAFAITGVTILSSLAVGRWGLNAFALILAALVAMSFGLVATGWARRKVEDAGAAIGVTIALPTTQMADELGMLPLGSWLLGILIVLVAWLGVSRGLPWWQSRRGDSH